MTKTYVREPREPLALFTQREDGVRQEKCFACGECGSVCETSIAALLCCKQQVCASCGGDAQKWWTLCSSCRDKKMWDNATEIEPGGYDGPVYDDSRDKYFSTYDEAVEYFFDDPEEDRPEFLFACIEDVCPKLNVESILEDLTSDLFEGAYDHLKGIDELKKACAEFAAKQTLVVWSADTKRKIRLIVPEEQP